MKKTQGYILRYYLPVQPYFDQDYTDKRFAELLSFCKQTKISAVMFYVALSPDFYYVCDSVDYAQKVKEQMLPYIDKLRTFGISYQLNFQNFMGSTLGGVNFSDKYDWENLVDHKGRESFGCGCPIGEKFRAHAGARLKIWAETKPDVIWIDDDFRLHNHGTPIFAQLENESAYMDFYCFCDNHISLFNALKGYNFDREELVKEITKSGSPSPIREEYLDFLNQTMVDTARWIEQLVHSISPDTRIAQMTSFPDVHSAEGRKWEEFLPALCGQHTPMTRPHFGPYRETYPREFINCYKMLSQSIKQIKSVYKGKVEYCPEVENTRFTTWSKSAAATAYQLALSAFTGCNDVTLSLFDLDGGAFFDEPRYLSLLKDQRKLLDKLVNLDLADQDFVGVNIPTCQTSARKYLLRDGEGFEKLSGKQRNVENNLLLMGIPCAYHSTNEQSIGLTALDEYSASFLTDEQLKDLLSKRVFLDGGATRVLIERGYGEYIGVNSAKLMPVIVNAEKINLFTRKDNTYIRIPSRIPVNCWFDLELLHSPKILSEFLLPDGRVYPAMVTFNNSLGGKVAIYPAKDDWGDGFFNHYRTKLFKTVFKDLDQSLPTIDVPCFTLCAVKRKADRSYILISNLSADKSLSFSINGKKVKEKLSLYQTVVYEYYKNKIKHIGKTKN